MKARQLLAPFALACVILMPATALAQLCGPVILAGHDADDHGFEPVYARLFDELLANTANGGAGILVLGADVGGKAANWFANVAFLMAVPQSVTVVNDADIATVDLTPFAIIAVPSDNLDTPGGISPAENGILAARKADIARFGSAGGGVFGLTQGELLDGWAYIVDLALIDFVSAPPSGYLPSGALFDNVSATAEGTLLGIDDSNLDGCCFHNIFTRFPPFLRTLAFAVAPLDPGFDGEAVFIGGVNACLSLPPLAVEWDSYSAERTPAGVTVRWRTLDEQGTTGFTVFRATKPDGSGAIELPEFVPAIGPRREYQLIDPAPLTAASWYFIQEYTVDGKADRSAMLPVDPASAGSSRRRRPAGQR